MGAIQAATSLFGVELKPLDARDARTIERGVSDFANQPNAGLSSSPTPVHRFIANLLRPLQRNSDFLQSTRIPFL